MYLAALKAFFSCSLVCVVVECSSDIKICSNRLEPVDGLPISACGNLAYLQHYRSFWYFWDMKLKKRLINLRLKKGKISGMAQILIFLILSFFGFLSIASFITMQI